MTNTHSQALAYNTDRQTQIDKHSLQTETNKHRLTKTDRYRDNKTQTHTHVGVRCLHSKRFAIATALASFNSGVGENADDVA